MRDRADASRLRESILEAARAYALRGWPVLPLYGIVNGHCSCPAGASCPSAGKHPKTSGGLKDATTDACQIEAWLSEPLEQNIAVRTGEVSGLLVVDTDGPSAEEFVRQAAPEQTLSCRTAKGYHRYYRHPGDGEFRNTASQIAPKLDTRGDGGYVVAPPSLHVSGRQYEWIDATIPIRPLPEALRKAWLKREAAPAPLTNPEGTRNTGLASFLGRLRAQGMEKDELLEHAREYNECNNDPPLAAREVERVARSIARYPSVVAQLNETFAHIIIGDKECVIEETGAGIEVLSIQAFLGWHRGRKVRLKDGKEVELARVWLHAPFRRRFRRMDFLPPPLVAPDNTYNLFQGWSVPPRPTGSWARFREHLLLNVCGGDEGRFEWVFGWFAQLFQIPAHKVGTALALRGPQGTGKTTVGEVFGRLARPHHFVASSPHQVTGNFNAHLRGTVLLQAEEAFWAGDKAAEGILKDLITSPHLRIEFKGKDMVTVRNCVRLLVTSNSEWVVPASFDDRRFTVLDVGDARRNDHEFFGSVMGQLEDGGYSCLMHDLLAHRFDEDRIRRNLDTGAARDQKIHALTDAENWIVDLASSGFVPGDRTGNGSGPTYAVYQHYCDHAHGVRARRVLSAMALGKQLVKWLPGLSRTRTRLNDKLTYMYDFPALAVCREALQARFPGLDPGWDCREEWIRDPRLGDDQTDETDEGPRTSVF